MSVELVVLWASESSQIAQTNTTKLETLLNSKKVEFTKVDGTGDGKEIRAKLFDLSGEQGNYPQVFYKTGEDYEFIGTWEQIEQANEISAMIKDAPELKENPEVVEKLLETILAKVWPK